MRIVEDLQKKKSGIEDLSFIHDTASVGKDVYVGAFAYIGKNVSIGNNVKIYPHCYIGDNVQTADTVPCILGSKYITVAKSKKTQRFTLVLLLEVTDLDLHQIRVIPMIKYPKLEMYIKEGVEIGQIHVLTAIMGSTIIHKGVKLDNMIQVAHNVEIGENTVIASHTAIAGSSKVGENCMIGGQVAIAGHLSIANNVKVAGKTGIAKDIKEDGKILQGPLAFDLKDFQRSYIYFRQLSSKEN